MLCFHTWGVRIMQHSKVTGPANLMENFADHRLGSWKGTKPKLKCCIRRTKAKDGQSHSDIL